MPRPRHFILTAAASAFLAAPALAQQPATRPAAAPPAISLNFPEAVPLKVLVDYVSRRLNLNIIYDDTQVGQRVTIQTPEKISETDLLALLESVLRMRGLTLVDADVPGFKRVTPIANAAVLPSATDTQQPPALTKIFRLEHNDPTRIDPVIKPLLTQPGGNSLPLPDQHAIVVTDFAPTVAKIADLLRSLDTPAQDAAVEFLPVKNADAQQLARQLTQILAARAKLTRPPSAGAAQSESPEESSPVDISIDPRTSQLVLVGPRTDLAAAREVLASLDVPIAESQSPVRFYKLANTTAADVLSTILALEGGQPARPTDATPPPANSPADPYNQQGQSRVLPSPSGRGQGEGAQGLTNGPGNANPQPSTPQSSLSPQSPGHLAAPAETARPRDAIRTKQAQITADPNTNTIIVVADPAVQKHYEQLIKSLDKRRPQVLIEATIVTLDTTDNFTFGVEVSAHGTGDQPHLVTFSQFGLADTNNQTGQKFLKANDGFNGALINNGYADVILQALKTNSRARVSSAPKILVNDNATGTLTSIAEQPFTSINTGNTIATTSFAGYAEAGTEVTLTPHISEDDYLQLDYVVSLSSFTANPTATGVPPPRQRDAVQSRVTIPDGSTIVVGGLNRKSSIYTKNAVPILGEIPLLEYLFSTRSTQDRNTTLFVFLRPVILRDERFADLKTLSQPDIHHAEIPTDYPKSEPLQMR